MKRLLKRWQKASNVVDYYSYVAIRAAFNEKDVNPFEGKEITLKPDNDLYEQLKEAVMLNNVEKVTNLLSAGTINSV